MQLIDAHHHLWDLDRHHYPWLAAPVEAPYGRYDAICHSYLVDDFLADVGDLELLASVHVQAEIDRSQTTAETDWLQQVADSHPSGVPQAIVAYADLSRPDARSTLETHLAAANLRGIRQILNSPAVRDRRLLADPRWIANFALLERYELSFDLQISYDQAVDAAKLARRHLGTALILNHAGMPMKRGSPHDAGWHQAILELASCPNVAVKISGLGMADPEWTTDRLRPYVMHTLDAFGTERCMFASNFPVDRLFGDYRTLWGAYAELTADLSPTERHALFVANAARYYRI